MLGAGLKKQSTMTGLGACLFVAGVVLLFIVLYHVIVLYHEAARTGPLPWIAGALLIGTIGCWAASAAAETPRA